MTAGRLPAWTCAAAKLAGLRTSCKDRVHAVLAKPGIPVTCTGIFGTAGSAWLGQLRLPRPYGGKITSLRHLAGELTTEITLLSQVTAGLLAGDRGHQVIQQLPGIGPVHAAVIIAGTGDVTRFKPAAQLCSWAGLTPRHREPGAKVVRDRITKMACAGGTVPLRRPGGVPWRWLEDSICIGVS